MSSIDKEFYALLNKVRNRLYAAFIIKCLIIGIGVSASIAILLSIISRFVPIYKANYKGIILVLGGAIVSIFYGVIKKPNYKETAITVDALGLKERIITAVELQEKNSVFADLQKKDALEHLREFKYKEKLPVRPKNKYIALSLIVVMCFALTTLIPNSMEEKASKQHSLKEAKNKELKKVEKIEKEIKKNEKLTEEQKKELENKIAELKKDIKNSTDEKELDKTLKKDEKKLELARDDEASESLKKLKDVLEDKKETKSLAEAIKNGDKQQLQKEMKKLSESIKNMSEEEKNKLSKTLSDISKEMKDSGGSKETLSKLSEDIARGDMSKVSDDMSKLSNNIAQLMDKEGMKEALEQMEQTLADGNNQGENPYDGNQSGQNGSSGQQAQQGQQGQQGNSQEGAGGNGAGNGSGKGDGKAGEVASASGGLKKDSSQGKEQQYEKIYAPKNLGGTGTSSQLNGKKNSNGSTNIESSDDNNAWRGENIPYNQVIGEYKDRAMETMNNSDIPEGMRDLIKNYFTSLEN